MSLRPTIRSNRNYPPATGRPRRLKACLAVAATAGMTFASAGCGSSSSKSASTPPSTAASTPATAASGSGSASSLHSQLPASMQKGLTMATDPTIGAPFAYFGSNNQTIVGADVDLADAIGQSLGAPVKVQNTNFDDFIPGLEAGRFDFSVSLMLDTPAREKQVTFVDFIKDGSGFLVAGSSNLTNLTLSDLCGKTAGATAGSVELDDLNKQSSTCTAAGKQPVWVHAFQKQSDGILALSSGRIVAYDGDSDQNAYIAKTSSAQVKVSGQPYGVSIDGIPMPKSSALIQPLQTALQHLMDDGSYGKILSKWGIQNYALTTATINHP